jgi:hypothetical protein
MAAFFNVARILHQAGPAKNLGIIAVYPDRHHQLRPKANRDTSGNDKKARHPAH